MGLHRLTAGAGYTYLLKHTAAGDCDRLGHEPLVAYYQASGNPPGRWMGSGLTGLDDGAADSRLTAGTVVVEEAMAHLFGAGRNPRTGAPLGRPYPMITPTAARIAAQVAALPAGMGQEARVAAVAAIHRVELGRAAPHAVAGFDLTFTPPKSVSTFWALADPPTQAAILAAHRDAVAQTLTFVEQRALFTRTGHGGCRQEPTRGLLAAGFDHWDSRAGDPNLHTHVVVANKVQGVDGGWRSVDSRALHHAVVAASETYDALLADALSRALPVRWSWTNRGPRRSPVLDLVGVEPALVSEFSSRTTQIDEAMTAQLAAFYSAHGRGPNRVEVVRLRAAVTRSTRPAKTVHSLRDLVAGWVARATGRTGRSAAELTAAVMGQGFVRPLRAGQVPDEVVEHLAGLVLEQVMVRRSTWTRWNVHSEAARATRGLTMATPTDRLALLDAVTDTVLARCVSVEAPSVLIASGRYARPDGTTVFDRVGEDQHTHLDVLAAEARLLTALHELDAPAAHESVSVVATTTGGRVRLADDQQAAAATVTGSGRRVDVLVGPAGAGKTTALLAVRTAWEQTWGRGSVIGLATSSTAAAQLAAALGVGCENTAKWIHESVGLAAASRAAILTQLAERAATTVGDPLRARTAATAINALTREQARWTLHPGQLVIVDEASLAPTRTLDILVEQARAAGAKVLLVGDDAQLGAVDAGGAFALLAERGTPARLTSLWRFAHRWEADATIALRLGDPRVLPLYDEHGRIHSGPAEAMLEDAYTAWTTDTEAGLTSVLIAPDAASVAALNGRAHRDRVSDGLVLPGGVTTDSGDQIGVGDRVVTRANDRRLRLPGGGWVRNGDLWDVTATHPNGALTLTPIPTRNAAGARAGGSVQVPSGYVAAHVEHGYASTTHRSQGLTADTAHVLAHAGMTRENLYVAMSRGRATNHVYVATDTVDPDCEATPTAHATTDPHEVLATILATPGAQTSATATIAARQDHAESLAHLDPIRRTLLADAAHARWTTRLTQAGLPEMVAGALLSAPDAGRLLVDLERLASLTPRPGPVVRGLLASLDEAVPPDELAGDLHRAASDWVARHTADPHDLHPIASSVGLDPDGLALLGQVDAAISARFTALTGHALQGPPPWLAGLGPEPTTPAGRTAWLDAVAATAARLDQTTVPTLRPATTPALADHPTVALTP